MKAVASLLLLCSAHLLFSQARSSADLKKIEWLLGRWERTNGIAGHPESEEWKKISDTEWKGVSVRLSGADTVALERITLLLKEQNLYYIADVPVNPEPVSFKVTEISNTGFVCENPQHDFPQKIVYRKTGSTLKASLSGGGKPIDFIFEKR